jgi:hypothetical protein
MKKFAMAAVAAAAMTAGVAQAYTAGTFSNGVVVPNVIHNGASDTTAVGLVNQSGATKAVFWTFFDQDSKHVTDGCFTMTDKDYHPFVWVNEAGGSTAGKRGYLVFSLGAGATCATVSATAVATDLLAAHAFQVNTAAQDVAYTPVIDGPLTYNVAPAAVDLTNLGAASLTRVQGAAQTDPITYVAGVAGAEKGAKFSMRYFLDGGAATNIVVWSTGNQKGSHTVNIFDDKQNRKSVNFDLKFEELDWFDPAPIVGRPANFTDGFIEWDAALVGTFPAAAAGPFVAPVTGGGGGASVFSYSVISAPAFGAVQTVLGLHRN